MLFARNNNNMCNIAYRTFYPIVAKEPFMYAYGVNSGDTALPKNDDGSYGPISLGVRLPFFNNVYSTIYVNTNGKITFSAPSSAYVAQRFPIATPLIAPFWTDINTNTGGQIFYRESSSSSDLSQAKSDIAKAYFGAFNPTRLYIATWDQVAAYGGSSASNNTFQVVIATDGILSFLVFTFDQMSWPSSLLSSTNTNFGYNAGDNINFYSNPNSFTGNIKNVTLLSNVNVPGKWIFMVSSAATTPSSLTTSRSTPSFNGLLLYTLTGHTNIVYVLENLPNGLLASGGKDTSVRIWNPTTGSLLFTLTGHTDTIFSLVTLSNGNLASGSWDKTIKIWNPSTGSLLYTLTGHTMFVYSLALLQNGNLASCSADNTTKIWNPNNGALIYTLTGHTSTVRILATLPNGNLASGAFDNTVRIWNPTTGTLIYTMTGHTSNIWCMIVLPNGNLASGAWDSTIRIWNPNTGSLVYTLTGHTDGLFAFTILTNGNLASSSYDKTVRIWNPNTGSLIYTLTGHLDMAFSLATLPNGYLASGARDNTVKIWNPTTGSLISTLTGHSNYIYKLITLPNGNLASGSYDSSVKIWY
jgi:WD40 repeat protein